MYTAIVRKLVEERIPLGLLAVVVWASAMLFQAWGVGRIDRVAQLRGSVAEYDSLLAQAGGYALLIERLTRANDTLKVSLEKLSGGMARASDLSGLLQMLIERARTAEVGFVNVRPQAPEKGDSVESYPVLLEFTTSYASLGRFVAGIESQPNLARIERMAVSARSAHVLEVRLLVTVFLQPEEAAP
jgi:Tfp pilus assembly protein PilO